MQLGRRNWQECKTDKTEEMRQGQRKHLEALARVLFGSSPEVAPYLPSSLLARVLFFLLLQISLKTIRMTADIDILLLRLTRCPLKSHQADSA